MGSRPFLASEKKSVMVDFDHAVRVKSAEIVMVFVARYDAPKPYTRGKRI